MTSKTGTVLGVYYSLKAVTGVGVDASHNVQVVFRLPTLTPQLWSTLLELRLPEDIVQLVLVRPDAAAANLQPRSCYMLGVLGGYLQVWALQHQWDLTLVWQQQVNTPQDWLPDPLQRLANDDNRRLLDLLLAANAARKNLTAHKCSDIIANSSSSESTSAEQKNKGVTRGGVDVRD